MVPGLQPSGLLALGIRQLATLLAGGACLQKRGVGLPAALVRDASVPAVRFSSRIATSTALQSPAGMVADHAAGPPARTQHDRQTEKDGSIDAAAQQHRRGAGPFLNATLG